MDYSSDARWLTPNPLGGDVMNPQSFNRYAGVYPEHGRRVDNNPATLTDPSGMGGPWAWISDSAVLLEQWVFRATRGEFQWFNVPQYVGNSSLVMLAAERVVSDSLLEYQLASGGPWMPMSGGGVSTQLSHDLIQFGGMGLSMMFFGHSASWWGTFGRNFFKFSGGPGNVPTCAGQTLKKIGNDLAGGFLQSTAAETSLHAASVAQTVRAWGYAASRPNSLGGTGLICPECSSVFRGMMEKADFFGDASEAVPLVDVSIAAFKSIPDVSGQARNGRCAAALPVF